MFIGPYKSYIYSDVLGGFWAGPFNLCHNHHNIRGEIKICGN